MSKFKLGDTVRRTEGTCFGGMHSVGFTGQVSAKDYDDGEILIFTDGSRGYADMYEIVPQGPVRTETVTRRRIVPGVYGRLGVGGTYGANSVWVEVKEDRNGSLALNAPELRELARVALEIAEYLEHVD